MEPPSRVLLASANPKKAGDLAEVLRTVWPDVELVPRPDHVPDVVEDAFDFVGNARLKAVALADATGEVSLADDSGLEVDALGGAPGVRSARYAGDAANDADNVALLLSELARLGAVTAEQRRARFRCTVVLRWPDGVEVVADGVVEGTIIDSPRGDHGFGYDPVFVPDDRDESTFAEMSSVDKHEISHRGRALRSLADQLVG